MSTITWTNIFIAERPSNFNLSSASLMSN